MAAPLPPLPMEDMDFEAEGPEDMDVPAPGGEDIDPQFAADISEAFPDLDDAQISAIQRAVLGLLGR
jgi:hypothetical protein